MTRFAAMVALTALLSACSQKEYHPSSSAAPRAGSGSPGTGSYRSSQAMDASEPPMAPAPASAAEAARGAAVESQPEARPGLGTSWGETRDSRVSSAPFERQNPDEPFAAVSLHYNDVNGVRAMTRSSAFGTPSYEGMDVASGALTVRLLDASGRPLPTYAVGARHYVVGSDGERYVIKLRNNTGSRIEAVTTVDGLDVIDGRPGSFSKRGYLLAPWSTVEIDGFRQNMNEVAAFRFGAVRDAYAAKKGDDRNVGVIGVAFFNEQNAPVPFLEREADRRHDADPFPGRFASPPR